MKWGPLFMFFMSVVTLRLTNHSSLGLIATIRLAQNPMARLRLVCFATTAR